MTAKSKLFDELRNKAISMEDILRSYEPQTERLRQLVVALFHNMEEIGHWTDDEKEIARQAEKIIKRYREMPPETQKAVESNMETFIAVINEGLAALLLHAIYGAIASDLIHSFAEQVKPKGPRKMNLVNQFLAQQAAILKAQAGNTWPDVNDKLIFNLEMKKKTNGLNEIEELALKKLQDNKAKMTRQKAGDFLQIYVSRYLKNQRNTNTKK